jgi:hypothetical protein
VPNYLIAGAALALVTALPLAWKWQLGILRASIYLLAASMLRGRRGGFAGRILQGS